MGGTLETRIEAWLRGRSAASAARDAALAALADVLRREWPALAQADPVIAQVVAGIAIDAMALLPQTIARLQALLEVPGAPPALRHAVALALVYLVRRDDLIADDRPGGFGTLDDWLVLSLVLLALLAHRNLRRPLRAVWSGAPALAKQVDAEIATWRRSTMAAVEAVMALAPHDRRNALQQVYGGASRCLDECVVQAAQDAVALEQRTQALMQNPDLPRETLLGPVDASVWAAWEQRAAREADEARSMAETRAWMDWSRKPSSYVSPYVFGRLPRGGFVGMKRG